MLDLIVVDGRARGIVTRDLMDGEIESHTCRRGRARHRRLQQRLLPVDQRQGLQRHRGLAGAPARRGLRQPVLHADPPDLHPVRGDYQSKLTLMSESLRNDGRIWVPAKAGRPASGGRSPRTSATTTSSGIYPSFGNLSPRDISSRRAKEMVDAGHGVGERANGVYLDFADAIGRWAGRR